MKKAVLITALLTFGFSNAQEVKTSDKKVSFGVKAGLNLSRLNGRSDFKTGYHVGGLLEIKLDDKISLQPEFLFSTEGGRYSYANAPDGTLDYDYRGDYYTYKQEFKFSKIIVPVMIKYYATPNLSIEVGPQLSYIVKNNSNAKLVDQDMNEILNEDTDMNHTYSNIFNYYSSYVTQPIQPVKHDFGFKKLNFGLNIGTGYQLSSGLFFQARYNIGLTDFATNANLLGSSKVFDEPRFNPNHSMDPTHYGEAFKNSNIQFSVGYKFTSSKMKKAGLITGVSASKISIAQKSKPNNKEVIFGAKAGLNLSMLGGGFDFKAGFHLGGIAEIKFTDKISLQPELMFSTEGGKTSYNGDLGSVTSYVYNQKIGLNKIVMPIMFKYYLTPNLSLEVGPQLDYIVSGKSFTTITTAEGLKITEDTSMNNISSMITYTEIYGNAPAGSETLLHDFGFKKLNFGFNFGMGYQLNCNVFFQARYNLGLTDFVTNANLLGATSPGDGGAPVDTTHYGESFKSSNIQLSVGYKF